MIAVNQRWINGGSTLDHTVKQCDLVSAGSLPKLRWLPRLSAVCRLLRFRYKSSP